MIEKAAEQLAKLRSEHDAMIRDLCEKAEQTDELQRDLTAANGRVAQLEHACTKLNAEVCQTLGEALGYPWFKDDQKNFPGSTEKDGVCTGEHVAQSIAMEAAARITELQRQLAHVQRRNHAQAEKLCNVLRAWKEYRSIAGVADKIRIETQQARIAELEQLLREVMPFVNSYKHATVVKELADKIRKVLG